MVNLTKIGRLKPQESVVLGVSPNTTLSYLQD
jgi:hypothetical protein